MASSLKVRAAVSVLLLLGFYAFVVSVIVALLGAAGLIAWFGSGYGRIVGPIMLGIPAFVLASGLIGVRAPPFSPPGRKLAREEAPGLAALIDDLASRVGTTAPSEIYLTPFFDLGVTETGGLFGGRRVLVIGAPLFKHHTVQELRAGIAHELGHFAGGDTRLCGLESYTRAMFVSVLRSGQRDPFRSGTSHYAVEGGLELGQAIARAVVQLYARVYLRILRALSRRQEVAADVFAVRLAGSDASAALLDKMGSASVLYMHYLETDVTFAVTRGAMPVDVWSGFERCREAVLATPQGQELLFALRTRQTDPYDAHPADAERLLAFRAAAVTVQGADDGPASGLMSPDVDLDEWLCQATLERIAAAASAADKRVPDCRKLPWEAIVREVYGPTATEAARRVAEVLYPLFPDATTLAAMFARAVRAPTSGQLHPMLLRLHPALARMPPTLAAPAAGRVHFEALTALFQGALLERGAIVEESFGAPFLVFRLGDERVTAGELARAALGDPVGHEHLSRWSDRLASA